MLRYDVHGCTDVTGFGLIGHAREMALASGVTLEIEVDALQFLPGRAGVRARRRPARRPQEQSRVRLLRGGDRSANSPREIEDLLYDPQTSGGLLISLPESDRRAKFTGGLPHRPRAAARGESHPTHMTASSHAQPHHRRARCGVRRGGPRLVARIGPRVNFYKVGMELYAAAGMDIVRELLGEGKQVFLDLKLYDIPETVSRAVAQVAQTGVRFLTVHAVGSVMRAAVAARARQHAADSRRHRAHQFRPGGHGRSRLRRHRRRAWWNGARARPWSSAWMASSRRRWKPPRCGASSGPQTVIVTPGVRSAGADAGDQKRVATPAQAIRDGADYLVIGRQITRAADPAAEVDRILMELVTPK